MCLNVWTSSNGLRFTRYQHFGCSLSIVFFVFGHTLLEVFKNNFRHCKFIQILKSNHGQVLLYRLVEPLRLPELKVYLLNSFSFDDHLSQSYTVLALPQTKRCFYWRNVLTHWSDYFYFIS